MECRIVGMLAETSVHPGAGQSSGVVDLPVAREAATDYPVIPGSGLKGAFRERGREYWGAGREETAPEVDKLFGQQDNAGDLLVSDARLLLLPVRSLQGNYRWLTCPHLLERYQRDANRAGLDLNFKVNNKMAGSGKIIVKDSNKKEGIFLEERQFDIYPSGQSAPILERVVPALQSLIPHDTSRIRLESQLAIVADDDFAWFARYGLSVNARNVLNENKTSKNLWYEETIPPDSLFYTLLAERRADTLGEVDDLIADSPYLQVGGNETIGQGWFALEPLRTAVSEDDS